MKLYVGNLPHSSTEDEVKELFSAFGSVVSVRLISDRETGRSRGFGFVELSNKQEGEKAIEALDGQDFQGRNLVVNEAREQQPRRPQGGGPRRSGGFRESREGYSR